MVNEPRSRTERERIHARFNRERRKQLRMSLEGERKGCAALTERLVYCRNKALDGSEYCGQHRGRQG